MLAKTFRLPAGVAFRSAIRFQSPLFTLSVVDNETDTNRYGFIVSKKIDKRAVVRNRAKRLVRSVIEKEYLTKNAGKDVLFILKPAIKNVTSDEIRGEVVLAMEKVQSL